MNEFIKQQQQLAHTWFEDEDDGAMRMDKWDTTHLDTLITQVITNTGEELMRKCDKEIKEADKFVPFQAIHYKSGIDTLKKHITNVTGVE